VTGERLACLRRDAGQVATRLVGEEVQEMSRQLEDIRPEAQWEQCQFDDVQPVE
jgi:hypothetical protein